MCVSKLFISQEAGFKEVLEVDRRSGSVEMKIAMISKEIEDISKGHLDKSLQPEALQKLTKRAKLLNEEALRLLESLDG